MNKCRNFRVANKIRFSCLWWLPRAQRTMHTVHWLNNNTINIQYTNAYVLSPTNSMRDWPLRCLCVDLVKSILWVSGGNSMWFRMPLHHHHWEYLYITNVGLCHAVRSNIFTGSSSFLLFNEMRRLCYVRRECRCYLFLLLFRRDNGRVYWFWFSGIEKETSKEQAREFDANLKRPN